MDRPITLPRHDFERLRHLILQHQRVSDHRVLDQLETELERAQIVAAEDVPADVVTMNSTLVFEDEDGRRSEIDLVYPEDEARGRVSILSPLGAALLGLAVGDAIEWPMPDGSTASLRIISVGYQPEDAGDYHL